MATKKSAQTESASNKLQENATMTNLTDRCATLGIAVKAFYSAREYMLLTGQSQVWTYRQLKQNKLAGAKQNKDGVWVIPAQTVEDRLIEIMAKKERQQYCFDHPEEVLREQRRYRNITEMTEDALQKQINKLQAELERRAEEETI